MKNLNQNEDMINFTGTENWYKYPPKYLITDGIKYAAEKYSLYWFIDAIISVQTLAHVKYIPFQAWMVKRTQNDQFVITGDNGNGFVFYTQKIPFSDFIFDIFKVYLSESVILLPKEY